MTLNEKALGLASASAAAVLWVICSVFVVGMPGGMMDMSGYMVHANFSEMSWEMTTTGFLYGLVIWSVLAGITGLLIGYFYNRFVK